MTTIIKLETKEDKEEREKEYARQRKAIEMVLPAVKEALSLLESRNLTEAMEQLERARLNLSSSGVVFHHNFAGKYETEPGSVAEGIEA